MFFDTQVEFIKKKSYNLSLIASAEAEQIEQRIYKMILRIQFQELNDERKMGRTS